MSTTYIRHIQPPVRDVVRKFNAKKLAKEFFAIMEQYHKDTNAEEEGTEFNRAFVETRTDYFADQMTLTDEQWDQVSTVLDAMLDERFGPETA